MNKSILLTAVLGFMIIYSAHGQNALEHAVMLSHSGQHAEAEKIFIEKLSIAQADENEILLLRAFNLSWWGKFKLAEQIFTQLLEHTQNQEAFQGLGFNHLYQGEWTKAEQIFADILLSDKTNEDALKGIFLATLHQNKLGKSRAAIDRLMKTNPQKAEYHILKGRLNIAKNQVQNARKEFSMAYQLDSSSVLARKMMSRIIEKPKKLELNTWVGLTQANANDRLGLRRIDLFYRPHTNYMLYVFYDNSLTHDNWELNRSEGSAPLFGVGHSITWNNTFSSNMTIARRENIDHGPETYYNLEQNIYGSEQIRYQLGYILHQQIEANNAHVIYGGLDYRINGILSTELSYFYSASGPTSKQHRMILTPKVRLFKDIKWLMSMFYSRVRHADRSAPGARGISSIIEVPALTHIKLKALFLYQKERNIMTRGLSLGASLSF